MPKFYQGIFKPKNPKKYIGDPSNIIYRSGLEFRFMCWLDMQPDVVSWASEELAVPYIHPVDVRTHRYFPDFIFKTKKKKTYMVEIKPSHQCVQPLLKEGKSTKKFRAESLTWMQNQAKWLAASDFCKKQGWEFKILTEKDIYGLK